MKKLFNECYIITVLVISVILSVGIITWGITMKTYEEKVMEKVIKSNIDVKGFSGFKKYDVTFLKDDVKDSLLYYRMKTSWDNSFLEIYQNTYDEPAKREYYKKELIRDKERQDYFNSLEKTHPDLWNEIAITTYRINYLYTDETGQNRIEICDAKFNNNNEMLEYRLNSQSDWVKVNH